MSEQPPQTTPAMKVDFAKILARLTVISLNPTGFWGTVRSDNEDIATIYRDYLVVLGAITPICGFVLSIVSGGAILSSLVSMGVHYGLAIGFYFAGAVLVELLGPRFDCTPTRENAFRWLTFSAFPALVSGVLLLLVPLLGKIPLFAMLGVGLYSIFILWHGMPEMIGVAHEKRGPFFICIAGCIVVFGVLLQAI